MQSRPSLNVRLNVHFTTKCKGAEEKTQTNRHCMHSPPRTVDFDFTALVVTRIATTTLPFLGYASPHYHRLSPLTDVRPCFYSESSVGSPLHPIPPPFSLSPPFSLGDRCGLPYPSPLLSHLTSFSPSISRGNSRACMKARTHIKVPHFAGKFLFPPPPLASPLAPCSCALFPPVSSTVSPALPPVPPSLLLAASAETRVFPLGPAGPTHRVCQPRPPLSPPFYCASPLRPLPPSRPPPSLPIPP